MKKLAQKDNKTKNAFLRTLIVITHTSPRASRID
jgi:hypothetical protein